MSLTLTGANLNERVYDELRTRILTRQEPSGAKLSLHALADELGVSRSPVHHALTRLVAEGLLTVRPRRGYYVAPVTARAVAEGYDVRLALELLAAERSVGVLDESQLARFADLLAATDAAISHEEWDAANAAFHEFQIDLAGNALLSRFYRELSVNLMMQVIRGGSLQAARTTPGTLRAMVAELPADGLREAFERDGYLIFDPEIPENLLDRAVSQLRGYFVSEPPSGGPRPKAGREDGVAANAHRGLIFSPNRVQDAWKGLAASGVAMRPASWRSCADLYGREPLPSRPSTSAAAPSRRRTRTRSTSTPIRRGLHVRRVGGAGGHGHGQRAAGLLPGQPPMPGADDAGRRAWRPPDEYKHTRRRSAALIESEGLEPRYGTISKGQALVWASNLLHGGCAAARP